MKQKLNESLIFALADKRKEAMLRSVCLALRYKGKTKDYANVDSKGEPTDVEYLELVRYGLNGCTMKVIADILKV
jgi:hypothetical protein